MLKKIKCLFFGHDYQFERNIHGDEINHSGGSRTLIKCSCCNEVFPLSGYLVPIDKAPQNTSDGYHSFYELYHHRMLLFSVICETYKDRAWKSKLHHDGTMYDNYFVVGIDTPQGQYSYHYHMNDWNSFDVKELERAPEWDGHKPKHVYRLKGLVK